jgi:hypothetical protein
MMNTKRSNTMTEKKAKPVAELKSRGEEMEYGANRVSKRLQAKANLLYRMFRAKRDTQEAIAAIKRAGKLKLNLSNKPLGA